MLSFPMAPMGPYPPRTAVSSVIKWGSYLHSGLTLSYLTDVLWGLMKLCLQCFQFLEKNYLWTFQVLCRYISDLSFLLLYCCVVLTYSIKLQLMSWPPPMAIRALNFPPVHLTDAGLTVPGTTEDVSPPTDKMVQDTGLIRIQVRMPHLDASALPEEDLWLSYPEVKEEYIMVWCHLFALHLACRGAWFDPMHLGNEFCDWSRS